MQAPSRLLNKGNCEKEVLSEDLRTYHSKCRPGSGFLAMPTGFLLQGSKDVASGWKLVSSFIHEIDVVQPSLVFSILMESCTPGGGIGHGIRELGPIHSNNPSNPSCLSLMARCSLRSSCHHSMEFLTWSHAPSCNLHCSVLQSFRFTVLVCHVNAYLQASH